ncbi:hypothetical protein TNCV_1103251 [Trichonephila clavipes]|nr:hypothetical protein TNCV_1103251 [Trichonephila clavipes]
MESLSGQSLILKNLGRVDDEEMIPTARGLSQDAIHSFNSVLQQTNTRNEFSAAATDRCSASLGAVEGRNPLSFYE